MRAIKFLLIIGVCVGLNLEAGHDCACKPKITKEMKHEKKSAHHEAHKRTKKAFKEMRRKEKEHKNKCYCAGVFQTQPICEMRLPVEVGSGDDLLADNGRVKRDGNGDRV